jgi:type II secretory pathway pseudopilin PulG
MKAPLNLLAQRPMVSRGMALIEALVALAVMAFGLLGVVGMQVTLRTNADVSRQRAEAVRMAQEQMETLRNFGALTGAAVGGRDYAGITGSTDTPTPPSGFANTTFSRTVTVVNPGANDPKMKTVTVEVAWRDRRTAAGGTAEVVRLMSTVAGAPPELAATLGLPGDQSAPQRPRSRNIAIPPGAVDQGNGTSSFAPPGAAVGTTWTFSNATGQITEICPPAIPCTTVQGWLLSGYINFATGNLPSATEAEFPTDGVPGGRSVGIQLNTTTSPTPAVSSVCYSQASLVNPVVAYNCFVPTNVSPAVWSGQSLVTIDGATSGSLFATSHSLSFNASEFKVCRYTNQASHTPTSGGNPAHPLTYTNVNSSLVNQNFLVISAGDVNSPFVPFTCPSPLSSGHTFPHQPSS